jgi:RNA polymerase sigma-70 factor, ECF subfamily
MATGHADEFEAILEAHWASVLRLGLRMTGDQNEAEEIAQHTFFLAYRAWPSFKRRSAVSTWLFRIAVNACKRHMIQRRRRERVVALDESSQPVTLDDDRLELRELRDRIEAALQRASPAHRLVLTLFWIDQLDHESIAEILGCPVGTVWSRLFYARAALARQLGLETE